MKISYRTATLAMAAVFTAACWISTYVPVNAPRPAVVNRPASGAVSIDWCDAMMWEQTAASAKFSALAWLATLVVVPIAGLLNRRLPRWISIFGLLACAAMMWTVATG